MSFSTQRDSIKAQNSGLVDKTIYTDYIKEERSIDWDKIKKIAVYTLWEDIARIDSMTFNLEDYLGNGPYHTSCGFATDAMQICIKSEYLNGAKIKPWLKEVLHCFDGILIHYIQETLKATINQIKAGRNYESDVYESLKQRTGIDNQIGHSFAQVYQMRNTMEHLQYTNEDGKRIQRRFSNSKYNKKRDTVLKLLKEGLDGLLGRLEDNANVE